MNIGLALMIVMSLLPIGLAQTWASIEHGLWYARSADFLQLPVLQSLRWVGSSVIRSSWQVSSCWPGLWPAWSAAGPTRRMRAAK